MERRPAFLIEPTLADLYDRAMDNEPVVGIVGTVDIHFGMLGHGSFFTGGDRDIALTRSVIGGDTLTDEGFEWNLPPREAAYYKLPNYANDVPGFEEDVRRVDQADGKLDGMWRDNSIDQLLKGFDTPARTPYQERVIETVIQEEGFGEGRHARPPVPELQGDRLHQPRLVHELARDARRRGRAGPGAQAVRVVPEPAGGQGNWVLALTADHGAMPDPEVSGGFQISTAPIEAGINENFDTDGDDTPVVDLVQPSQVFLNVDGVASRTGSRSAMWRVTS